MSNKIYVLRCYSLDIICSSKLGGLLKLYLQKAVHFLQQILSAGKYPSIFSLQMDALIIYNFFNVS